VIASHLVNLSIHLKKKKVPSIFLFLFLIKKEGSWALVAHVCNPSYYARCRDQENGSSKTAQANSSMKPYLKKPFTKIGLVEWLKVKP
jgi:hypothetical protein